MVADDVFGDLGPGIPRSDDKHAAGNELRGISILDGVKLPDLMGEFRRERRYPGALALAHGDDHLVRREAALAGRHFETSVTLAQAVNVDAVADWQIEFRRISFKVVRHVIFSDEAVSWSRDLHAVEAVVLRRSKHPEGVPTVAPGITRPLVGIQNYEWVSETLKVVASR